jgi:hypothetical protein
MYSASCRTKEYRPGERTPLGEAAIRSENDLIELLSPDTAAMSALPRRADVVNVAAHVA